MIMVAQVLCQWLRLAFHTAETSVVAYLLNFAYCTQTSDTSFNCTSFLTYNRHALYIRLTVGWLGARKCCSV